MGAKRQKDRQRNRLCEALASLPCPTGLLNICAPAPQVGRPLWTLTTPGGRPPLQQQRPSGSRQPGCRLRALPRGQLLLLRALWTAQLAAARAGLACRRCCSWAGVGREVQRGRALQHAHRQARRSSSSRRKGAQQARQSSGSRPAQRAQGQRQRHPMWGGWGARSSTPAQQWLPPQQQQRQLRRRQQQGPRSPLRQRRQWRRGGSLPSSLAPRHRKLAAAAAAGPASWPSWG